jgi:hypothetical protein
VTAMCVQVRYVRSNAKTFFGRGGALRPPFVSNGSSRESSSRVPTQKTVGSDIRRSLPLEN